MTSTRMGMGVSWSLSLFVNRSIFIGHAFVDVINVCPLNGILKHQPVVFACLFMVCSPL